MIQQLDRYRTPPDWQPGASLLLRTLWFCAGAPLLSARWLPGSAGLRIKSPWRLQLGAACWLAEDAIVRGKPAVLVGHR